MSQQRISSGVVHEVPADLEQALISDPQALTAWEDITPLARNEWICWVESAKACLEITVSYRNVLAYT